MNVILREVGNSLVTTIPKDIAQKASLRKGDTLDMTVVNNNIVIKPHKKRLKGEVFLEEYYKKSIEEIKELNVEYINTGTPVGEEIW